MSTKVSYILACLAAIILLAAPSAGAAKRRAKTSTTATAPKNSFNAPDFAFPKDVAANAGKYLRSGSDLEKTRAAMQITIADNLVEPSTVADRAAMLDSLANALPDPYRSLLFALEAKLYADVCSSDFWQFSRRSIPVDNPPTDPMQWSEEIFSHKVQSLVSQATASLDRLSRIPIADIATILDGKLSSYQKEFPDVASFVTLSCVNSLSNFQRSSSAVLPIAAVDAPPTVNSIVNSLIDKQIALAEKNGHTASAVRFILLRADYLSSGRYEYLLQEYSKYKDSAEGLPLLIRLSDSYGETPVNTSQSESDARRREVYELLREADSRYADKEIKATLCDITMPSVNISVKDRYLSTDSIRISVAGSNVSKAYILLYSIPESLSRTDRKSVVSRGSLISATPFEMKGEIPYDASVDVLLKPLPYGRYALLLSNSPTASGIVGDVNAYTFHISDLQTINSDYNYKAEPGQKGSLLYVVSGRDMKPVKGATVTFSQNQGKKSRSLVTDADGAVAVPDGSWNTTVTLGKDRLNLYSYNYPSTREKQPRRLHADILTDLAIYHPGDTVRFAAVLFDREQRNVSLAPQRPVKVELRDANSNAVDTLSLTSDNAGRLNGEFPLPKHGLLGRWSVAVTSDYEPYVGDISIQVADYKTPTFFVELLGSDRSYLAGDTVNISGNVTRFSGVPVADADIAYTVTYRPWRWGDYSDASYSGKVKGERNGAFTISLPTEALKGTRYGRGTYVVTATATSPDGETQSSRSAMFALGSAFRPDLSAIPSSIPLEGKELTVNVPILDLLGHPVEHDYTYLIKEDGKIIASGTSGSRLTIASPKPGRYTLVVTLDSIDYTREFVLLSPKSDTPPYAVPLWLPEGSYVADRGSGKVEIPVGNSYKGAPLLAVVSDCNGIVSREWIHPDGKIIKYKVDAPAADNLLWVRFFGCHDLDLATQTVTVYPAAVRDSLTINSVSFRDHITPGDEEHWRFSVRFNGKGMADIPVFAVMTDKALNSIAPFAWYLNPRSVINYYNSASYNLLNVNRSSRYFPLAVCPDREYRSLPTPQWQLYGCSLYSRYGNAYASPVMYKSRAMAANTIMFESVEDEASADGVILEEKKVMTTGAAAAQKESGEGGAARQVELSDVAHPLAFFRPNLTSAADGDLAIDFTVPAYNTTWQLQLAAYDTSLHSAVARWDAVSSKAVMVQANFPRYLRTDDQACVAATLINNTDSTAAVKGVMEVFDPVSGTVITRREFPSEQLSAKGQRTVGISFPVADKEALLGVRCYAIGDNHSDGQQDLISILPSSTPVIDATDFYLGGDIRKADVKLPEFKDDANVTLQYCDNPIWYCLTALPDISTPTSSSLTAKVEALFGNAVAFGIAESYPAVRTAISYWEEALKTGADSTLVSNLIRNPQLKSVPLENTTWVNDATSESLRMQRLSTLLDPAPAQAAIKTLTDEIVKLQHPDGGWSWVPQMRSSAYITRAVLENIAALKDMDCLRDEIPQEVIASAVKYCDSEIYKDYIRSRKKLSTAAILDWLAIRENFNVAPTSQVKGMLEAGLSQVRSQWRSLDIYGKATAAILFAKRNELALAKQIAESLSQYAVTTPGQGMYYDNIGSGWNGFGRLVTTARVLRAFLSVDNDSHAVDGLVQWLILQRQVQDWGYDNHTAAVVYAILKATPGWSETQQSPVIEIDGRPLDVIANRYTGEFTLSLDPSAVSGKTLSVSREADSPAWGGVIAQYVAPTDEVKSASTELLSISKAIYRIDGTTAEEGELKVGDKVRITLTLNASRDLQYVSVADSRGACLEPADQISSYTVTDGLWVYRETRDASTILLLDFLPRGTHVITYDCYVDRPGRYTLGIAQAQSLYAPAVTAHTEGRTLTVVEKTVK